MHKPAGLLGVLVQVYRRLRHAAPFHGIEIDDGHDLLETESLAERVTFLETSRPISLEFSLAFFGVAAEQLRLALAERLLRPRDDLLFQLPRAPEVA